MIEKIYENEEIEIYVIDDEEECEFEHYDNVNLNECECFN